MTAAETAIHETHKRYFQLILRHGTDEEKAMVKETLEVMQAARNSLPEATWEPMEEVLLPGFLIDRARRVAASRIEKAKRFSLESKHGAPRSLEVEEASVMGQYACCLTLGLPFDQVTTHQGGKAHGNVGSNVSAFTPLPGRTKLLIAEKEPPARAMVLVVRETSNVFSCRGYVKAAHGKIPEFQHEFVRDGVVSRPYLVPSEHLSPIRDWFAS